MKLSTKRTILHILFPNRCPVCGEVIGAQDRFCTDCHEKLTPYSGETLIAGSSRFIAAFEYDGNVSPAVMLLKNGVCGNAAYALGGELADILVKSGMSQNIDVIVPVPLHRSDRMKRGFDQTELIAREVSRITGIPVSCAAEKIRLTLPQKRLGREERMRNLAGAFSVPEPALIRGKRVLLLDDVCTTGSTLAELAEVLINAGVAEVFCAACCKTPDNIDQKT
ncbi:MAG: ComF family protein [Ruminococcus sp.]|nr:ComF family protein [Ruminococcus sp.]